MNPEPRQRDDYSPRQVEAARRVLVDLGQVLAAFEDCLVVVGGWVPDLPLAQADEPHVGSIDVDLALDANKLAPATVAQNRSFWQLASNSCKRLVIRGTKMLEKVFHCEREPAVSSKNTSKLRSAGVRCGCGIPQPLRNPHQAAASELTPN